MARFDIYNNPGKNKGNIPFLVEVQSNVISGLATRIMIPLRTLTEFSTLALPADLFPIITVNGVGHFLDTPQMGVIPLSELNVKVGAAQEHQLVIQTALDRMFGAY